MRTQLHKAILNVERPLPHLWIERAIRQHELIGWIERLDRVTISLLRENCLLIERIMPLADPSTSGGMLEESAVLELRLDCNPLLLLCTVRAYREHVGCEYRGRHA